MNTLRAATKSPIWVVPEASVALQWSVPLSYLRCLCSHCSHRLTCPSRCRTLRLQNATEVKMANGAHHDIPMFARGQVCESRKSDRKLKCKTNERRSKRNVRARRLFLLCPELRDRLERGSRLECDPRLSFSSLARVENLVHH